MKPESLVTVDQNATVNTFSSLVLTARQVSRVSNARSTPVGVPRQGWRGALSRNKVSVGEPADGSPPF